MPSYSNMQIIAELKDIVNGLKAGEIIVDKWQIHNDVVSKWTIESWELADLRPMKSKQVVKADKIMDGLIKKLDLLIAEYAGYKNHGGLYVALMDMQYNQTYDTPIDLVGVSNVKLPASIPGPTYITMELRVGDMYTFAQATAQATANLTKAMTQLGTSFSLVQTTIQQLSSPCEIKDLGVGIEPIVGYRDFYGIIDPVAGLILTSRNGAPWVPREKHFALCAANYGGQMDITRFKHDAPDDGCKCGIYAFDQPDHDDMNLSNAIWGEVNLWGKVLLCESGYRAQFAYPKTLFMFDDGTQTRRHFRDKLEAIYGVPTFLVNKRDGQKLSYIIDTAVRELTKGGE